MVQTILVALNIKIVVFRSNLLTVRHLPRGPHFSSVRRAGEHIAPALFCIRINVLPGRSNWATPTTQTLSIRQPALFTASFVYFFVLCKVYLLYSAVAAKNRIHTVSAINFIAALRCTPNEIKTRCSNCVYCMFVIYGQFLYEVKFQSGNLK
jgi:hypothetical protein